MTNFTNKVFDSIDPTNSSAAGIQFEIAGQLFPNKPVDLANNKAQALSELCLALYGNRNILDCDLGITATQYDSTEASVAAAATLAATPACFLYGVNCEAISSNSLLMTGTDTRNASVNTRLNIATALTNQIQPRLIVNYDALLEFDIGTRNVTLMT